MTQARVLTFHVDPHELPELTRAVDDVADQFALVDGFRGLVCLERDGIRNEIIVISLWEGDGLAATEALSEVGRRRIAETTDLGVCTRHYEALRIIPSSIDTERLLENALAS